MEYKEDFLQYIWRYQLFKSADLRTTDNEPIQILKSGTQNKDAGPDFSMTQIKIGDKRWVGNVEIHKKSSDWIKHKHSRNPSYQSIILHVVGFHDVEIPILQENKIPTLELNSMIDADVLHRYKNDFNFDQTWIPCQRLFHVSDSIVREHWIINLLLEKLEERSKKILQSLEKNKNWDAILFYELAYGLGLKINSDAMRIWASSFPFKLVQILRKKPKDLAALFFGTSGFLNHELEFDYPNELKKRFLFLQRKYHLKALDSSIFKQFRLRPANFPTIRIAQIASLYSNHESLFSKIIEAKSTQEIEQIFTQIHIPMFWEDHFTFQKKSSKKNQKNLSKNRIQLLIINVIIPIKYCYENFFGRKEQTDWVDFYREIPQEKNRIIDQFFDLGAKISSAAQSQGYLQLKKQYCDQKKCLHCRIGYQILTRNGKKSNFF